MTIKEAIDVFKDMISDSIRRGNNNESEALKLAIESFRRMEDSGPGHKPVKQEKIAGRVMNGSGI